MRGHIQPFREGVPAGRCSLCRDVVFAGDLAYRIDGETYCFSCVKEGSFIADIEEDEDEHLLSVSSRIRKEVDR